MSPKQIQTYRQHPLKSIQPDKEEGRAEGFTTPALVYLASLAPSGRRTMAARLTVAAQLLGGDPKKVDWSALRFEHVTALRSRLSELGRAPASVNATLSALRGVARAAWQLRMMSADDFHLIAGVKNMRGSRLPAGRALTPGEIGALLDTCAGDETAAGARDAAIIALLYGAGLRRSEAAALDLAHYNSTAGELKVRGKGDAERLMPLEAGVMAALDDWISVRGSGENPLLCPVRKGGKVELRRMSAQSIYDALLKRAGAARIQSLSPHDLRRTFASDLLDVSGDVSAVQKLLGHANVQTTMRYDRRGEAAKRKAINLLHLPYRSRQNK
jgi:site-specific recombinase XerC